MMQPLPAMDRPLSRTSMDRRPPVHNNIFTFSPDRASDNERPATIVDWTRNYKTVSQQFKFCLCLFVCLFLCFQFAFCVFVFVCLNSLILLLLFWMSEDVDYSIIRLTNYTQFYSLIELTNFENVWFFVFIVIHCEWSESVYLARE